LKNATNNIIYPACFIFVPLLKDIKSCRIILGVEAVEAKARWSEAIGKATASVSLLQLQLDGA